MAKYYKVKVRSEYEDLSNRNTEVIVKKGIIFSKEIATSHLLVNCDNTIQGKCYDYYVLSSDFIIENIASLKEVRDYLINFEYEMFPPHTRKEERETTKEIKKIRKELKTKKDTKLC